MGASPAFWHDEGDGAEARFLAEHGAVGAFDGDAFVVSAGREDMLPAWPPDVTPVSLEDESVALEDAATCAVCATPVARHGDAGWRHEVGLAERGGCQTPWPEG